RCFQHLMFGTQLFWKGAGNVPERISWTTGDDELAFAQQLDGTMPFGDTEERIDADQKIQLVRFLQLAFHMPNGFQRVIRLSRFGIQTSFRIGRDKDRMSRSAERNHRHAVGETGKRLMLLVWRKLSRHEQHFAEFKPFDRALGDGDMSAMDRIEGTAEERDVHGRKCKWNLEDS